MPPRRAAALEESVPPPSRPPTPLAVDDIEEVSPGPLPSRQEAYFSRRPFLTT